ncbi:amino acid ABC transporter substrate-binding protein [Vibrio sp. JPW-9-11-11]|uniref:substrate-binding periplasmic protein n=1 Tax=Vibrio sp. JPW-9-11-11 TaxID=1416532 RepID=UPI0015946346|nr:transporter substrate-binding domain-containing protein [Vibrio sp. JPW-9-11-11]NVD09025.1 amino acid ABC transporter substrate-binding protein [Vibrio sp. JPW-9-11-11]
MHRFIVIALCFLSIQVWGNPTTIKLTNGEWPPYLSKSLPNGGPSSQVIVEAFKLQGIEVVWGWYPWQRSYILAEEGEYDGTVIWSENAKRQAAFMYTSPVLEERRVLFHLKETPFSWNSVADLSQYEIGGTIGYEYSQDFQDAENSGLIQVRRIPDEGNNFKKLLAKRIDLVVATENVGYSLINTELSADQAAQITHASKPIDVQKWSVLISNNCPHQQYYVDQFNIGFAKLVSSGRYDEIMSGVK